jgi:hypothetical protein
MTLEEGKKEMPVEMIKMKEIKMEEEKVYKNH